MDVQRWREAQEAEQQHVYHSDVRPEADAKHAIESYNIDYNSLEENDILVVGSGTGIGHSMSVGNVVAIDPLTQNLFKDSNQSSVEILTGVGEHLPFESESFDTVLNRNVLDHTADPEATLCEIRRVLKSNGKLLFNINIFSTPQFVNKHLGKIDTPHPHHYNKNEILSLISESGFDIQFVNTWTPNIKDSNLKKRVAVRLFGMKKIDLVAQPE